MTSPAFRFAAFLTVLCWAVQAQAQTTRTVGSPSFIVAGGLNVSRLSIPAIPADLIPPDLDISVTNGSRVGFVGGVLVEVPAHPRVSFVTGGLVSTRGGTMKVSIGGFGSADVDFQMIYADVPLLAAIPLAGSQTNGFSLLGGGMLGLRLDARLKGNAFGESASESFTDDVPVIDFGVTIGGAYTRGRASAIVYYTHGLMDTSKGEAQEAIKHRVVTMMAGWRF